jgi:enolase-phosphatase E1
LASSIPPAAILLDVEGTVTPIAFVRDVLFPFARARLREFCDTHEDAPVLGEVARLAPDAPIEQTLRDWMDADAKMTPLKTVQGMIWAAGYASGEIIAPVYADVPPALRRWAKAGLRLYVYSSGSVAAQKLLFRHSNAGDLSGLFQGFFDTGAGGKREAASYAVICRGANIQPAEFLFLSDVEAELDAAAQAGLRACQLVRAADGTAATLRHPVAADFAEVGQMFGLPVG